MYKKLVPSDDDWNVSRLDIDQKYAYGKFGNITFEDAKKLIFDDPIMRFSDIRVMPEIPFLFYLVVFSEVVDEGRFKPFTKDDAIECFISLTRIGLVERKIDLTQIACDLIDVLERLKVVVENADYDFIVRDELEDALSLLYGIRT